MSVAAGARPGRRAITDPRRAPTVPADPRWQPVPAERHTLAALRQRFSHPPHWSPEYIDDRFRLDDTPPKPAAVLLPLIAREGAPTVLLTVRAAHLTAHAGQVAFPGGRIDPGDASAADAALREAYEEVGLPRAAVELLGPLPPYLTGTGYAVTPVVGWVDAPPAYVHDPIEVAEIFEVPLAYLLDPAHHQHRLWRWDDGAERQFLAMPWTRPADGREFFIWGVTAAILRNFYRFLAA